MEVQCISLIKVLDLWAQFLLWQGISLEVRQASNITKNSKSVLLHIGRGVFHESLNLASINNLPVIVVENNLSNICIKALVLLQDLLKLT